MLGAEWEVEPARWQRRRRGLELLRVIWRFDWDPVPKSASAPNGCAKCEWVNEFINHWMALGGVTFVRVTMLLLALTKRRLRGGAIQSSVHPHQNKILVLIIKFSPYK